MVTPPISTNESPVASIPVGPWRSCPSPPPTQTDGHRWYQTTKLERNPRTIQQPQQATAQWIVGCDSQQAKRAGVGFLGVLETKQWPPKPPVRYAHGDECSDDILQDLPLARRHDAYIRPVGRPSGVGPHHSPYRGIGGDRARMAGKPHPKPWTSIGRCSTRSNDVSGVCFKHGGRDTTGRSCIERDPGTVFA